MKMWFIFIWRIHTDTTLIVLSKSSPFSKRFCQSCLLQKCKVSCPAVQSVVDKNTYLVEKMSQPDLTQLKGGEMFFTLNFSPFILFNIHEVFLFMMFLTVLTSRCQEMLWPFDWWFTFKMHFTQCVNGIQSCSMHTKSSTFWADAYYYGWQNHLWRF